MGIVIGIGAAALLFTLFGLLRMGREPEHGHSCTGNVASCPGCSGGPECVKEERHLHVVH